MLDDLAAVLRDTVAGSGADAIALYLATGMAYDAAGQIAAGTFLGALGSSSFYTAVTVDNAPVLVAAELVTGNAMMNPLWDPTAPGLLLLVGTNPIVSHGYGTTLPDPVNYLRDFRRAGGRIWVVDPRRTESATLADHHVAARPGSDVLLLAAIAGALLDHGADPDELTRYCTPDDVAALRAGARALHGRARGRRGRRGTRGGDGPGGGRPRLPRPCGGGVRHRRADGDRRRPRGMAAVGPPHPHRVARPARRHAHPARCPEPPAATASDAAAVAPGPRQPARAAPRGAAGAGRRARRRDRSGPASACWW